MAILGYDTKGGTIVASMDAGRLQLWQFNLASAMTLTELHGWFTNGSGSITVRLCIYADTGSNAPGARKAYSSSLALTGTDVHLQETGLSVALAAGNYWLGFRSSAAGGHMLGDAGSNAWNRKNSGASDPPPDPFGTVDSTGANKGSVWGVVAAAASVHTGSAALAAAGAVAVAGTVTEFIEIEGFSVAFDNDPMDTDVDWTRIDTLAGCHVQEYTIDRGRPTEFDKTDTGTAVVRLIDREGLFDPTNTSSPYNGLILPGKQAAIALQNPVSDTWFTLFRGFVESWHYRLDQTRQYMELEIQLVDGFAILSRAILDPGNPDHGVTPGGPPYTSPPYATGEDAEIERELSELAEGNVLYGRTLGTVKDRIDGILEDVGWPDALRDTFTGNVRVGPKAYNGASALDAIWDAVDAEWPGVSNCWMSKDGVFTFRGRQARFRPDVAEYGINERTVGDPSGWELDDDVVPVAELEWSVGQDTIYNAATATPQWVWADASHTTVRQLNPGDPDFDNVAGQYVKNDASIAAYGLRSITFDQLQTIEGIADSANSMVETKKYATYYVENYKSEGAATTRLTRMVFKTRRPGNTNGSALWLHMCRCEISDLLTLKTAHPGSGGFLYEKFFVEGLHYTIRPGTPTFPIVELSLDLSSQAHYTTEPDDWAPPEP